LSISPAASITAAATAASIFSSFMSSGPIFFPSDAEFSDETENASANGLTVTFLLSFQKEDILKGII